jgi:ferredoxin
MAAIEVRVTAGLPRIQGASRPWRTHTARTDERSHVSEPLRLKLEAFFAIGLARVKELASTSVLEGAMGTVVSMTDELTAPASSALSEPAAVTFARSGKSMLVSAVKTVLEASEDLDVNIDYDCRSGICGQCKTRLLAGHVIMDVQDALDLVDRANNVILSCQARCLDHVVVEA